jgi:hypothetical protein
MRLFLIISAIFFNFSPIFGQKNKPIDFSKVDKFALQTPDSMTTDVEKLALYLTTSDVAASTEKKIRAIYVWVSQNIHYDQDFDLTSPFTTPDVVATQDADRVLAARKGVCMGYSHLFVALVQAAGLKAEKIEGIIKQSDGNIPKMGHAWVAVRLRKKADKDAKTDPRWYLCDPTWGSPASKKDFGTINEAFFLAEPEDFIKDHLPLDPMWQLLERPATVEVFAKETEEGIKKYVSKSSKNPFIYTDTINRFLKMDSLKRLEKATWRMLHYNPINDYIWFEVGKVYSRSFNAFNDKVTNLIRNSIFASTVLSDDEKFDIKLNMLRIYYNTFNECFSKITDKKIAEDNVLFTEKYLNSVLSMHRSGFQVAKLNAVFENKDRTTLRFLETVKTTNERIDSTLSSTRNQTKLIDTNQRKRIEIELLQYEKIGHQKNTVFTEEHLEELRMNGVEMKQKSDIYTLLSQGKMHNRKYKACQDSLDRIIDGEVNGYFEDEFFIKYAFFLDIEECLLNSAFLSTEVENRSNSSDANGLTPYIKLYNDAYACTVFTKENGHKKTASLASFIDRNVAFFKHIEAGHEVDLGYLYHSIAINIWNENLRNMSKVKSDLLYNLNLSEANLNQAISIYNDLLKLEKGDKDVLSNKRQILKFEEKKKEIVALRKQIN